MDVLRETDKLLRFVIILENKFHTRNLPLAAFKKYSSFKDVFIIFLPFQLAFFLEKFSSAEPIQTKKDIFKLHDLQVI